MISRNKEREIGQHQAQWCHVKFQDANPVVVCAKYYGKIRVKLNDQGGRCRGGQLPYIISVDKTLLRFQSCITIHTVHSSQNNCSYPTYFSNYLGT